ncbi:MAG: CsbD family protein [Burkholderiaceae bacterium]
MNRDQIKGTAKHAAGKVQESAGKIMGSKTQQAKGLEKQASGKIQKGMGDVSQRVKDATK